MIRAYAQSDSPRAALGQSVNAMVALFGHVFRKYQFVLVCFVVAITGVSVVYRSAVQ